MTTKYTPYADAVEMLRKENRLRILKPMIPINGAFILFEDQKMLSFCSHDCLGMGEYPEVKKRAVKHLLEHGLTAATESVDLYSSCQKKLEQQVSRALARETALFFPSRYEANVCTLATLSHSASHVYIDEAAHPSFFEGAAQGEAEVITYPHERLDLLEQLLQERRGQNGIIAIESIFSLTGAIANIPKLAELASTTDNLLMVDDSHALGVAGVEGMGLASHIQQVDILTGSFSKAVGARGGFVACSQTLRDFLTSHNPRRTRFLLPPPFIGAIEAALALIPQMEGERKQLEQRSHWLRSALRPLGFDLPKANTPLISLVYETTEGIERARQKLKQESILVGPTCRFYQGSKPRLRLAINVCHMPDHLARLVEALQPSTL